MRLVADSSRHSRTLHLFFTQLLHPRNGVLDPHPYAIPTALRACAHLADAKSGELIHSLVLSRPLLASDAFVGCALIHMYCKCGRVQSARKVFDEMPDRDLVVWNALLSGYAHGGAPEHALVLALKMRRLGVEADLVSWNAVVSGFAQVGDDQMATDLFRRMQEYGFAPDVVTWTSLISGSVLNLRYHRVRKLFQEMAASAQVLPSPATISALLPAFANVADARHGKEVHGYAVTLGAEGDLTVGSALVDMYAKCGLVGEAKEVFAKMRGRSTVTWNTMIFGLANSGYCREAVEFFDHMLSTGTKPDHLTFTAALTACSHGGMVNTGKALFRAMQEEYGVEPRLEHCACMVDLFGRSGKLADAYGFIKGMPMEPDRFVWGALLGACRNHGNVELAELAASSLLKVEPGSAASCLLLSNVLADAGKQGDAFKIKKLMKRRRLKKLPGCSWVQAARPWRCAD